MRIVLTGAASFTGLWFAQALIVHGHEVVAVLRGPDGGPDALRRARIERLHESGARVVAEAPFGSDRFLGLLGDGLDVLCHHGAEVRGYKDIDFDVMRAVAANTCRAREVLMRAQAAGCRALVATGSVFEPDEGRGEHPLRAFSPYGLSKGLSWQVLRLWAGQLGITAGKFVIANPFGPWEAPRFGHYLVSQWVQGRSARVATPDYVRDNIHVDLLSLAYRRFVQRCAEAAGECHAAPSGYIETQGAFAQRFAREIGARLRLPTPLELAAQHHFDEPRVRVNTEPVPAAANEWSEAAAWDAVAEDLARQLMHR